MRAIFRDPGFFEKIFAPRVLPCCFSCFCVILTQNSDLKICVRLFPENAEGWDHDFCTFEAVLDKLLNYQSIFWGKHLSYFGREQNLWYPHIRKPPRHLVRLVFLVGHGTKWVRKANIWPKMTKNAYFGPNLAIFGRTQL